MTPSIKYFLPYQRAWIGEPSPLAIGEKSRRIGFTHAQAYAAVEGRVQGKSDYFHSSADKSASLEFVEECERWCRVFHAAAELAEESEVIDDQQITMMQLRFKNGRRIVCGTSNPRFFRSKGGHVGLDEFAFHAQPRELFKAAHAAGLFWGYTMRIWSTHNGEGSLFNRLLQAARSSPPTLRAATHCVTVLDAVDQGLVERIRKLDQPNPIARRDWLEDLRSTVPDEDTWNEEYLCVPSSGQNALLGYDLIGSCEEPNLRLAAGVEDLPNDGGQECPPHRRLYAGFDVGRKRDLSVLWVLEKVGDVFWTRLLLRLPQMHYTAQEDLLIGLMSNKAVRRLCIDATGIGAMLAERLCHRFGHRAEGLNFSAPVKADLAMPLLRVFQDRRVRIPADHETREPLHKVRKIVTAAGNVRLDAERDEAGHADEFWALALAVHAADDLKLPLPAPRAAKPLGW